MLRERSTQHTCAYINQVLQALSFSLGKSWVPWRRPTPWPSKTNSQSLPGSSLREEEKVTSNSPHFMADYDQTQRCSLWVLQSFFPLSTGCSVFHPFINHLHVLRTGIPEFPTARHLLALVTDCKALKSVHAGNMHFESENRSDVSSLLPD